MCSLAYAMLSAFTLDENPSQKPIYAFLNINLNCSLQIAERAKLQQGEGEVIALRAGLHFQLVFHPATLS